MFTLRRVTAEPASPIKVMVDAPQGDGDAGLTMGGVYHFYPSGSVEGEDTHQVSQAGADAIMGDPELAKHFECSPNWQPAAAEQTQPSNTSGRRKRATSGGLGSAAEDGEK